jgi:ethanolamine-phosphate cytidylyltransferase
MSAEDVAHQVVAYVHDVLHSERADELMAQIHELFRQMGFPKPYPDAERLAIAVATGFFTLLAYFVLFGKRHRRRRKVLQKELQNAYDKVQELQEKLAEVRQKLYSTTQNATRSFSPNTETGMEIL